MAGRWLKSYGDTENGRRHGEKHNADMFKRRLPYPWQQRQSIPRGFFIKPPLMRSRIAQVRLRNACTCTYMAEGGAYI